MKKFSLLFLLIAVTITNLSAQNSADPQNILDRASSKLRASKGITSNFSLIQKDKTGRQQGSTKGVIKIKGNKYYVQQGSAQVFCNGTQLWNFDGQNEATVTKVDNNDADDLSPAQILSGFNKTDFSFKLNSSAGTNYQVQLIPVDKRKNFKQVIVYVNKSSSFITKAVITDKTGNITEISFSGMNINASIPDSQFSFDASKHPGVEVITQ